MTAAVTIEDVKRAYPSLPGWIDPANGKIYARDNSVAWQSKPFSPDTPLGLLDRLRAATRLRGILGHHPKRRLLTRRQPGFPEDIRTQIRVKRRVTQLWHAARADAKRRAPAHRGGRAVKPEGRICAVCRRTRLSRYNQQQVCAACVRAAREPPELGPVAPQWPSWLWGSAPMRHVLARGDLGTAVAMFRAAAHMSQQELADLTGWSQPAVSLVETGRRDTLYDIRELLKFADAVAMPREALLPLLLGRPAVLVSASVPDDGQTNADGAPS